MRKETVVVYFKKQFRNFRGETEEKIEKPGTGWLGRDSKCELLEYNCRALPLHHSARYLTSEICRKYCWVRFLAACCTVWTTA
jgi:hypothetical protein